MATPAILLIGLLLALGLAACRTDDVPTPTSLAAPAKSLTPDQMITIGDIEPDEPTKKIKRFQPLADYLAEHLKAYGIEGGQVVLARTIEEMGGFLGDGTVDIYFDSPFPFLGAFRSYQALNSYCAGGKAMSHHTGAPT